MNQVDLNLKKYEIEPNWVTFYFDEVSSMTTLLMWRTGLCSSHTFIAEASSSDVVFSRSKTVRHCSHRENIQNQQAKDVHLHLHVGFIMCLFCIFRSRRCRPASASKLKRTLKLTNRNPATSRSMTTTRKVRRRCVWALLTKFTQHSTSGP